MKDDQKVSQVTRGGLKQLLGQLGAHDGVNGFVPRYLVCRVHFFRSRVQDACFLELGFLSVRRVQPPLHTIEAIVMTSSLFHFKFTLLLF